MTQEEKEKVMQQLKRYQGLCREIKYLEEEIEELESKLIYHRGDSEIRSGTGGDHMAEDVARMVDLTEKQHEMLMKRIKERDRISSAIDKLDEPEERMIMRERYIQGNSWYQVFIDCWDKGWSTMFRVHNAAVEKISKEFL